MINILLKQTLAIHSDSAYQVAHHVRRSPSWISMVTQGTFEPTEFKKHNLENFLNRSVSELFGQMRTV